MNQQTGLIDKAEGTSERASASRLRDTRELLKLDRAEGLAALDALFHSGRLPEPSLDGRYRGELIALDVAPGLTVFFQWLASAWMPWRGKTFSLSQQRGENIFARDSYPLARLFNPLYRDFVPDGPVTYRGFAFRTYPAPGLVDTDRVVLKIDYDLEENPSLTVRRVLDELVQVDSNLYLGKAHVRWWWRPANGWQTVAYFSLSPE